MPRLEIIVNTKPSSENVKKNLEEEFKGSLLKRKEYLNDKQLKLKKSSYIMGLTMASVIGASPLMLAKIIAVQNMNDKEFIALIEQEEYIKELEKRANTCQCCGRSHNRGGW